MARFTVDTHLFRELGELLVGRDSTALVELIKNAYDADATLVTVHGDRLDDPEHGRIVITDNGLGMTPTQFEQGFLCIASRVKEQGERRSRRFGRRFTGAKGVGRLAAHKLARNMQVFSIPALDAHPDGATAEAVMAGIDWDLVEAKRALHELDDSGALSVKAEPRLPEAAAGTIMELQRLRRHWLPTERARVFWEVQTFQPVTALLHLPPSIVELPLLFDRPRISDIARQDPGFKVDLTGDFVAGEEYWQTVVEAANWIIEIDAREADGQVHYRITPTQKCRGEVPTADQYTYVIPHPNPAKGPFFHARILVREGSGNFNLNQRGWLGRNAGIRVFMESFRVLPYGEAGDDWLEINADFKRTKTFRFFDAFGFKEGEVDQKDAAYMFLRNDAYFGGVFLTQAGAPSLRMLVNREGFVPDADYENLVRLVRIGTDLSVRHRCMAYRERREGRRSQRQEKATAKIAPPSKSRMEMKKTVDGAVKKAGTLAEEAKKLAAEWKFDKASECIESAAKQFSVAGDVAQQLVTEPTTLRILASVGLQMSAFVHEISPVLATATKMESVLNRMRSSGKFYPGSGTVVTRIHAQMAELRRAIEHQASYLTEIASPDAQRRRSRQNLRERFDASLAFVLPVVKRQNMTMLNEIPEALKSPPMFKAEVAMVFTNLLTNAVKAADKDGTVRAWGRQEEGDLVVIRVENTGIAVNLENAARWFLPFTSTAVTADPVLGQGMGMGLPISRDILEEYGAEIQFVPPEPGYATAVEIRFH